MLSVHNRSREKWVHSRGNGPFSTRCVIVFRTGEENDPNDRVHSRRRADKGGVRTLHDTGNASDRSVQ